MENNRVEIRYFYHFLESTKMNLNYLFRISVNSVDWYKNHHFESSFDFKRIALLIILITNGQVRDKANLIFEIFSKTEVLYESDMTNF